MICVLEQVKKTRNKKKKDETENMKQQEKRSVVLEMRSDWNCCQTAGCVALRLEKAEGVEIDSRKNNKETK